MSIESELNRIINAKEAIKDSISAKGVAVPANAMLEDMAELIDQIGTVELKAGTAASAAGSSYLCNIYYLKTNACAIVFFSSGYVNVNDAFLILPTDLQGFSSGKSGDGCMWTAGSPKSIYFLPQSDGTRVQIVGQGALQANWNGNIYGWCILNY